MELELITQVDPKEFGLEESKVKTIEEAFTPKIIERDALKVEYEELITQELTNTLSKDAKVLRLKLVKVRTGISDIHKTQKSFFLAAGKFVDAWKNKETLPVTQMEEKLGEIEKHFEKVEAERKQKLISERKDKLTKYDETGEFIDLANMPDEDFDKYLNTIKSTFESKIQAEKEAEEQRIEEEEKIKDERKRLDDINALHASRFAYLDDAGLWVFLDVMHKDKIGTYNNQEYKELMEELVSDKKVHDDERARVKEENARLKEEANERVKIEVDRIAKEAQERKIREEKERKEREVIQARLKIEQNEHDRVLKELVAKKEAEKKAEAERAASIQAELNKGDADKVNDLISDLEALKSKYEFKSKKNQKLYSDVGNLIDKVIGHINK